LLHGVSRGKSPTILRAFSAEKESEVFGGGGLVGESAGKKP